MRQWPFGTANNVYALNTNKNTALTFELGNVLAKDQKVMLSTQKKNTAAGNFSINTGALQTAGVYELASNVTFAKNSAFTINLLGRKIGLARVGGSALNKNGMSWKLATSGKQLNLTVNYTQGKRLLGTAKNDTLNGIANCDIFYGGAGNDKINGVGGHDIAVYDKTSWGKDTILKTSGAMSIVFKGLGAKDASAKKSGADMIITRNGAPAQSITVKNWNNASHEIVYGGTLAQVDKYLKSASVVRGQAAAAELWQKTGMLA